MSAKKKSARLHIKAKSHPSRLTARRLAVVAVAIMLAVLSVSWQMATPAAQQQKPGKQPRVVQVRVDAVISETRKQTIPVIGRLVALQTGVVAARTNGPVGEVRVEVGDRVKQGDVIAVLVKDMLQWRYDLQKAEVNQYAAALKTRNATTKLRQQELKRIQRLIKSAAFSQARLEDKKQEVAVSESQAREAAAQLARAKANKNLSKTTLDYATIKAPYSGVVSKRHIELGAYVQIGEPVVTLVNDANLEIEADVPADRTAGLTPGTQVSAFLNGKKKFKARVRAVVPEENTQTRTRRVRFIPDFSGGFKGLASNQSVTLHLPSGRDGKVVTVHKDAVLNRKGSNLVFIAKDGKATILPVRLGEAVGSRFIVLGGLKVGDLVVVRGNERLIPGQAVRFKPPASTVKG